MRKIAFGERFANVFRVYMLPPGRGAVFAWRRGTKKKRPFSGLFFRARPFSFPYSPLTIRVLLSALSRGRQPWLGAEPPKRDLRRLHPSGIIPRHSPRLAFVTDAHLRGIFSRTANSVFRPGTNIRIRDEYSASKNCQASFYVLFGETIKIYLIALETYENNEKTSLFARNG